MKSTSDPLQDPRFGELVTRLRGQAAPEPAADFSARVLARLHEAPAPRGGFARLALRAAAALALLLGAGVWMIRPAEVAQAPSPIDILMAAQQADGGWSADAEHLRPRYDVGVTALALLALIHADPTALEGPQADAIRSGMAHLIRQQSVDGQFGADFSGAAFTQYLAAMALQAAARLKDADPAWQSAAVRAAPHLPPGFQMAKLNSSLARPDAFPARWADAGGPVTQAALQMFGR